MNTTQFAGPFKRIPYEFYVQSPVGLVPKHQAEDDHQGEPKTNPDEIVWSTENTRLIFHLSWPKNSSVNFFTPKEKYTVKYRDLDDAIHSCLETGPNCYLAKLDMKSAFRNLPVRKEDWMLLVMMARHPKTNEKLFFMDKCVPFGHSISCCHFQRFFNAVEWILRHRTNKKANNYMNNFLLVALFEMACNNLVEVFLQVCTEIRFPVALDKTFWATQTTVFLGMLLNTRNQTISVPLDKREKAVKMLEKLFRSRKITHFNLQQLTSLLNYIARAVVPARAFTHRYYAKMKGVLKPHHHIRVDGEMKLDAQVWLTFLQDQSAVCCPFSDFKANTVSAMELKFASDASRNPELGYRAIFKNVWISGLWEPGFVEQCNPSIEYLELYALTVAIFLWIPLLSNKRVILFCDNEAVVYNVNASSASSSNSMFLIRAITLKCLRHNVRIFMRHVRGKMNVLPDLLSRNRLDKFWELAPVSMSRTPEKVPQECD